MGGEIVLEEFTDLELESLDGEKRYVLFTIVQETGSRENRLNDPLYHLQRALKRQQDEGRVIEREFIYGDRVICRVHTEEADRFYYTDGDVCRVDSVHLLFLSAARMKEHMQKDPQAEHVWVILLDGPLRSSDSARFLLFQKQSGADLWIKNCRVLLMTARKYQDALETYVEEHQGMVRTWKEEEEASWSDIL